MTQWPDKLIQVFERLGYEHYGPRIQTFVQRWGGWDQETCLRILREGEGEDKLISLFLLGEEPSKQVRSWLLPFLQSPQPKERWVCALVLGQMQAEEALPVLLSMLTEFFPPPEHPTFLGEDLWFYNMWRRRALLLLTAWPLPEVDSRLLQALYAYHELEQAIPEDHMIGRREWRKSQALVMYTLGWHERFDLLDEVVKALAIVQPTLSSWRVYLALGSLHAHRIHPRITSLSLSKLPDLREQVKEVLQERFGLTEEDQERCLDYYQVQLFW